MTRVVPAFSLLLGVAMGACGGKDQNSKADLSTRQITGHATYITRDEAGRSTSFPIDLHTAYFGVQAPASAGGWEYREGKANADGSFTIAGAPTGDVWLEHYDALLNFRDFLWTDAAQLNFEEDAFGRADAVPAASADTKLAFDNITGIVPASDPSLISFNYVCANLGIFDNKMFFGTSFDTALSKEVPWTGRPLSSAAAHDQASLIEYQQLHDETTQIDYTSPVASLKFDPFNQVDGQTTHLTGAFSAPPDLPYTLNWKRSAFAAQRTAIHPKHTSAPQAWNAFVGAMFGGTHYGITSALVPGLMQLVSPLPESPLDLNVTLPLKNPFPSDWVFNQFVVNFAVNLPVPGNPDQVATIDASLAAVTTELPTADKPVVPLITPVRDPKINGQDLHSDQMGVGLTPKLSWTPPEVGTPTAYIVTLYVWNVQPLGMGGLQNWTVLFVPGDATEVSLPERALEQGQLYVADIRAVHQEGQNLRTDGPYKLGLPYGYADAVTNTFAP